MEEKKWSLYCIELLEIKSFVFNEYDVFKRNYPAHFKNIKPKYESNFRYFKWTASKAKLIRLNYLLKQYAFISKDTSNEVFEKAFSNDLIIGSESLNIIWMPERTGYPDKASLIYLLHQLEIMQYLNEGIFDGINVLKNKTRKSSFFNKIGNVFCDKKKKSLRNIKNSFDTYKYQCPLNKEIDTLIYELAKTKVK